MRRGKSLQCKRIHRVVMDETLPGRGRGGTDWVPERAGQGHPHPVDPEAGGHDPATDHR